MDIWTERLKQEHLPLLERWAGRSKGKLTENDLPTELHEIQTWFKACTAEPGRLDFLALIYDTPVGIAGIQKCSVQSAVAELYLLIGETNYNLVRTATYVTLKMLDRAFLELNSDRVVIRPEENNRWFLEMLEQMGFERLKEPDGSLCLVVEKEKFQQRRYLF